MGARRWGHLLLRHRRQAAGRTDRNGTTTLQNIAAARASLGHVDMWVLALGTNDRPKSSAQLRTDANTVLSAIGPDHFVWIGIGFYAGNDPVAARVNSILSEAVAAAPNGSYTSWNSWIHSPLRGSGANWVYPADPIHMTKQGYAIRNEFYGRVVNRLWP